MNHISVTKAYTHSLQFLTQPFNPREKHLIQTLGRRHGSLDDKATNVLPALLEQRNEVVDSQHDVSNQLVLSHADIANRNTKAEHLLQLELDSGADLGDLGVHVLAVGDGGGEFTS